MDNTDDYALGQENKVDVFEKGDLVDIQGTSKGKGFQGIIKRHGGRRGPMTHGSRNHRKPGSIGACADPGRVIKGKKLPGHMGNETVTVQNLEVVGVDVDKNVLIVKGAVPGAKGGLLSIRQAIKAVTELRKGSETNAQRYHYIRWTALRPARLNSPTRYSARK